MRYKNGRKNSENRGAHNIRQIMSLKVQSGKADQDDDWETGETYSPACKE